ncbi:MAG: NAD(P)/FAD-dependent oxidoreductase [Candidatus Dormibacteria bacterium]
MAVRPHVVVIGAGFGGIATVRALRDAPVDVTLVDRDNYHLFQPLLYQVATSVLDPSQIAYPIRAILRRCPNAAFRLAAVTGIDLDGRRVLTDRGDIGYDQVVIAAGSVTNYFGIAGLDRRSFALKNLGQALLLRTRILEHFERAAAEPDAEERRRLLTFAIVGGGPTGVEFAGALSELIHLVLRKDFPELDVAQVLIVLADTQDHVLSPFARSLRRVAQDALQAKGVTLRLGVMVSDVDRAGLQLAGGGRLDAATVVWMGGVRAAPLAAELAVEHGAQGRIRVDPLTLRLPNRDDAYAIGDIAELGDGAAALPMLAPVAIQGGQHVAAWITAGLRGDTIPSFRYRDKGTMATIGRNSAVAQVGRLRLSGFIGWLAWLFVHLILLVGFRSRIVVLVNWAWDYFFRDRPVRLITVPDPKQPGEG